MFCSRKLISLKLVVSFKKKIGCVIHVENLKEFYFNAKEYEKDNEMRIKAAGDANKMLTVEQWATDIVAASITISRVIVPVGWRTESGKGGGEINEQTRDRAEKLANTRITPSRRRHPSCANARTKRRKSLSEFWLRLETSRKAQSVNQDGLSELTEALFVSETKIPKVYREGEDSTKGPWLPVTESLDRLRNNWLLATVVRLPSATWCWDRFAIINCQTKSQDTL